MPLPYARRTRGFGVSKPHAVYVGATGAGMRVPLSLRIMGEEK